MGETIHRVNGIDICAEVRGPGDGVPLLLVMGLGAQLVSWDSGFVDSLVERGDRVARFDNRDAGRSTHVDAPGLDVMAALRAAAGEPVEAPCTLSDMAADAAGLLDVLGMSPAHVVGASMGGMIVQATAIEQPQVVRSVVSIKLRRPFPAPASSRSTARATTCPERCGRAWSTSSRTPPVGPTTPDHA